MAGHPYRLLACDLDGTILEHNHHISDRVRRAISLVREQGVQVALVTGRSFQAALPFARLIDVHLPLICYQGGLIRHPDTGETLYQASLARELAEETIELSHTRGWQLLLYTTDEILLSEYRFPEDVYRQMLGPTVRQVADLQSAVDGGPIKMTILATEDASPAIEDEMRKRFGGRMEIIRSHAMFVEALPAGVSKGRALAWLAEYLDVPQHSTMAIGDQDNDASMVAWAGLGIAMGNGSLLCKGAADWIAPTIEEDGSAEAMERFLLQETPGRKVPPRKSK